MIDSGKFYDTCALLQGGEDIFSCQEKFYVSSITFKELERIKTAINKDADIKYSARLLLHLFEQYPDYYCVVIHKKDYEQRIIEKGFEVTDDIRILSDALNSDAQIFITNDLSLKHIARHFMAPQCIQSLPLEQDTYKGYLEITPTEQQLEEFYQDTAKNHFNLLMGEYLILKDNTNNVIDVRAWTGVEHRFLQYGNFNSKWFGKIKPYDVYQKLLFDSLSMNKITMVKGCAGSGKTMISLGYLMSEVEKGNLDKIIVFCNTIATANSAKLGLIKG